MSTVSIHEAKANLSKLVDAAAGGEQIIIAKHGKPVARLVPFESTVVRKFGVLKNKLVIADDFDAPLPSDMLADFGE